MSTSFNLNDRISATLTAVGVECLKLRQREIDEVFLKANILPTFKTDWEVGDLWTGQFYEFCHTFGPKMVLGSDTPVETIVELDVP